MYKSHLQRNLHGSVEATINGLVKAQIWDVSACAETNGMKGILVCMKAPSGEDASETYSQARDSSGRLVTFYDLGEFIPLWSI